MPVASVASEVRVTKKKPGIVLAFLPLIIISILLLVGYGLYRIKVDILLVLAALFAGLMAWFLGNSWQDMQDGIISSIRKALPAMLIVLTVGLLIGSWLVSGTIQMMIYYGIKMISPRFFLVTTCIVSSVVSLVTGTSWGTVGTVGIALIGVAQGLELPLPIVAGAIISGAYFGDKLSPFSDTTNLAPISAGSNLFDHIRHMLWTTLPAWTIGLIIYTILGLNLSAGSQTVMPIELLETLNENFNFNILLLLPPAMIIFFSMRKFPTIPGMLYSAITAVLLGIILQGAELVESLNILVNGYTADTGLPAVDKLLSRGGMISMMDVTLIAFCAFAFAGIIQAAGMLDVILESISRFTRTVGSLVLSTVISCIAVAIMTGSSFLSIIIPAELFSKLFREKDLAAKNLSRTVEDSGTVIVPLIPWSMAAIFMSGTLGVSAGEYLPWAFMNYLGFLFAIFYGFTGIGIAPRVRDDETQPGS